MSSRQSIMNDILKMLQKRTNLRQEERNLKTQEKYFNQMPTIAKKDLANNLSKVLPSHLVPTNVGSLKHVLSPYWYEVSFDDIGTDPTYGPNFRNEKNFQVTQESAFLLCTISRAFRSGGDSGFGAPLQVDIRDNQSTRQFNDEPIAIQNIGYKSDPTELHTPLLLMPNASVRITLSSWLPVDQATTGDGYQEISLGGYRVPVEDAQYILDNIMV
jgi:hypothetical protein